MDVQLGASGLEIDVAERVEAADFHLREIDEQAPISREPLKVGMALAIQSGIHLLDLEIGHVADAFAQGALVASRAAKLEALNQPAMRKHLARRAYHLGQADIAGKDADDVSAARHPDDGLVLLRLQLPLRVYLKKLRVQRSLKKAEGQFVDCYIDMRCFHIRLIPTHTIDFYSAVIILKSHRQFKLILSVDNAETSPYRTIILQAPQSKRVTAMRFFAGRPQKSLVARRLLLLEKNRVDNSGNDVVEGVGPGGDSETANCKKDREVNTGHRPKSKPRPVKWVPGIYLPAEEVYMVMGAEQRRRYQH